MDELLQTGEYSGPGPLGVVYSLMQARHALKKAREAAGLSLAEVAERSGIDKAALSRLENGIHANPTVETLVRYSAAVGKQMSITLEDLPAKRK